MPCRTQKKSNSTASVKRASLKQWLVLRLSSVFQPFTHLSRFSCLCPRFQQSISSRAANGTTVWRPPDCLKAAAVCVRVCAQHMWASLMSLWLPFEPFSAQKRLKKKKSIRCSTSHCCNYSDRQRRKSAAHSLKCTRPPSDKGHQP